MYVLYHFLSVNALLFISLNKECSNVPMFQMFLKTPSIDIHHENNLLNILQGLDFYEFSKYDQFIFY